jgi:electron transport complex protein RnfB
MSERFGDFVKMTQTPYQQLAARLNSLPSGFPATADGVELRLLGYLFTPEEAALAAQLKMTKETPAQIANRIGGDVDDLGKQLKSMAKRGLIGAGRFDDGLRYGLSFVHANAVEPQFHRIIPVNESIPIGIEIHPHESAAEIVNQAQAWGVIDCICRKQKALVGDACGHPIEDTCMVFSQTPGAFDQATLIHVLTREEALATLRHVAEIGLVHSLGNYREGVSYICNCCTCSCGILRGISEQGMANAVARSPFISQVDEDLCSSCEACLDTCQFSALALNDQGVMSVNRMRCVGCGQCVINCPDEAISLARRPADEVKPVPVTEHDWGAARAASRGLNLDEIL